MNMSPYEKILEVLDLIKEKQILTNGGEISFTIADLSLKENDIDDVIKGLENKVIAFLIAKEERNFLTYEIACPNTERFERYYKEIKRQIKKPQTSKPAFSKDLLYYAGSREAEYKGKTAKFAKGTKSMAILEVLSSNVNEPYTVQDIVNECNPLIAKSEHSFKTIDDIDDTLRHIKQRLGASGNTQFPIEVKNNRIRLRSE